MTAVLAPFRVLAVIAAVLVWLLAVPIVDWVSGEAA